MNVREVENQAGQIWFSLCFFFLVLIQVVLPRPVLAQTKNADGEQGLKRLQKAARSMDQSGNYTIRIKKNQQTENTNQLYTKKKNTTGTLKRTGDHILIQRTTNVDLRQGKQKKQKKSTTTMIGSLDPEAPLLTKQDDKDWTRLQATTKKNATAIKKHLFRGIEERSVSMLKSAEIDKEVTFRDTNCYRIAARGDADRIKSSLNRLYRTLGNPDLQIKMSFKKKAFTFWVSKTDPRILKFTSDLQVRFTLSHPRRKKSRNILQVMNTTYTFSNIGSTSIPKKYLDRYRREVDTGKRD